MFYANTATLSTIGANATETAISWWQAVILGLVEGITEFLPISSTAHLTITEKLMNLRIDDAGVTAFTAIIQAGAILATLIYFRRDLWNVIVGFLRGFPKALRREPTDHSFKFACAVIVGSIPIGIVGFALRHVVETSLRSLWIVAFALIIWSAVLWAADRYAKQDRHERDVTWVDTLIIGVIQCAALIPGVSRSGATMSAGLFRGLDRVAVTRLSFLLSIPALLGAGLYETASKYNNIKLGVGWSATLIALVVSFISGYFAIAWLLRFVSRHNFNWFVIYRVALGLLLIGLLASNTLAAS